MISVVVPVYNVKKYLSQCIESLMNQSYTDLEIILVDDGSTDGCDLICEHYKELDNRIKVIHKPNGGLSDARNAGMEIAGGDFICFIDSDDYVDVSMLEIMYSFTKDADVVICGKTDFYDDDVITENKANDDIPVKFMSGMEAFGHFLLEDEEGYVVAWNKLYRREIFVRNNIVYPVGKIHEDCFTTYKAFINAEKVAYVDLPLYKYRHRKDSIMGKINIQGDMDIIEAYNNIIDVVKEKYPELIELAEYRCMISYLFCAKRASIVWNRKVLREISKSLTFFNINNKYLHGQRLVRFWMLINLPDLFMIFTKIFAIMKK